ncbi:putative signal transducing protein [Vibrio ostreicida]|uniref:DUF2007 domain-containing protein n=1 Tax=Vibrio ostreicida TaxID=526588 RepID=A0ABT8BT87_9VIBR|nr:DUF2007 domain-containing protein [Vibrio ostreicida]MDN3609591.1 DUF2007 domain-containing protein [Vibrio ostreicida]NPD08463.1 DUF2007 domain-containing protein [Vibrio ostreicida]
MKLYIADTPPEAHIICELLKTNHIDCEVRGEALFGLQGEIPFCDNAQPYVWLLNPEQREQAQAVIDTHKSTPVGDDWQCQNCNEMNEVQFAACWQCGRFSTESPA